MAEIKAGWLYKGPRRTEQSQGWFVPVMDGNGKLALVDTYFLKSCYSEDKCVSAMTDEIMEMGSEQHQYTLGRIRSDYFYGNQGIHYFSELPDDFEEVCYLPDYKYVSELVSRDYDPKDVIPYVQLYFEHGYRFYGGPHGVFLVRKDAEKSPECMLSAAIDDAFRAMVFPHAPLKSSLERIKAQHDEMLEVQPELETRYQKLFEDAEVIRRMESEIEELLERQSGYEEGDS